MAQAHAIHYGGSAYISRAGIPSNTRQGVFSCWVKPTSHTVIRAIFGDGQNTTININTNGTVRAILGNTGGAHVPRGDSVATITDVAWNHILVSWDTNVTTNKIDIAVNGVGIHTTVTDGAVASDIDFAAFAATTYVGASFTQNNLLADLAEVYFAQGTYYDLTNSTNVSKWFAAAGTGAYLGLNGELPSGSTPLIYLQGTAANVTVNSGTAGAMTVAAGSFTDAADGPNLVSGAQQAVLPMLTMDATAALTVYGGAVTFPILTSSIEALTGEVATGAGTLPMLTLDATMSSSVTIEAVNSLPMLTSASQVLSGHAWSAELSLPVFELEAGGTHYAQLTLPSLSLASSAFSGDLVSAAMTLPMLDASSIAITPNEIDALLTLPSLLSTGQAVTGVVAAAALTLPALGAQAFGISGHAWSSAVSMPMFSLTAVAYDSKTWSAPLALPAFTMSAHAYGVLPDTFRAWAVNLLTNAVSEYTGFHFNSFAQFNGKIYAAGASGLFALDTSDTDAGTDIDAYAKTGKNDFGSSTIKRVPRLYTVIDHADDMEVHTITTEDGTRRYLLAWNQKTGIQQRRVPIGKGPKSRHWQFAVANRAGGDFSLSSMIAYPSNDPRRMF